MTLLQRWRFHPALPWPPCIPLSRCCPERPQPWHRLPCRRRVFLRLVAMGTSFLFVWNKQGFGLRGVPGGVQLNIARIWWIVLVGESQLGPYPGPVFLRERAWCLRESALLWAARVAKPGQRDPSNTGRVLDAQA